jgi:hypothetical protein
MKNIHTICTDLAAETKNQNRQIYNAGLGNIAMYEDHAMQSLLESPYLLYHVRGLCLYDAIYESLHDSPSKVLHTVAGWIGVLHHSQIGKKKGFFFASALNR